MFFRKRIIICSHIIFTAIAANCQYLPNPSFEGVPQPNIPPPGWQICNTATSTPDVQPGNFDVYLPPSHGNTYLGMTVRQDYTWEDVHSSLITPLSMDSCYLFKIDFAYQQYVAGYNMQPIVLRIYGYDISCNKSHLLWVSPAVSNTDWLTYEFLIHPDEVDITDLVLEVYYLNLPAYWGYLLMDNIRITTTPKFDLGNDTTLALCENGSLTLSPGTGFVNYLWQDGSNGSSYEVENTGLYWVQVFNAQGCSWTDSIFVTIQEYAEMQVDMFDSLLVCNGQEVTIGVEVTNGAPPFTFEWENLSDTTSYINIIANFTQYYFVAITDQCGNTIEDSIKLVVMPAPQIDLGNDTVICSGGDYILHVEPGFYQYLWQDGSSDSTCLVNEPGLYWVTVTTFLGCTGTDSINISLYPPIPLDLGNDTIVCEGEIITLSAGEGFVSYLWQDNSSVSYYTVTNGGFYWVTVMDDAGCTASDSIFISFLPLPQIDLGSDTSICSGNELVLDAEEGFLSYLWQSGETGRFYTVTQPGLYYVTVDNGCGTATDTIQVVVYPSPIPDLGPDTTICAGQSITLEPGNQFISYKWQDNSAFPFYVVFNSGIYSVEVENNFGCKASDEIYITVSDPQVNLGEYSHICEGDTIILDAGTGFVSYLWQNNSTSQFQTVSSGGTFSVTVQDEFGCEGSDEINLILYPYPVAELGGDKEICTGDVLVLVAPPGNFSYYWNGMPGDQTFNITSAGSYTLSVVNLCDSVTDVVLVNENPVPEVDLGEDKVIFPGETIELDAGQGHDAYLWQDGSGQQFFIVTENNINPDNPYYFVEVTEGFCKNSDTIKIELFRVWVPKVITPNGDHQNDLFMPDPERWQGVKQHNMTVLNRWGEIVWESNDFPSGWDGRQNGRYVADGTYFWILDVYYGNDNIKQTLKGSLTVLGTSK